MSIGPSQGLPASAAGTPLAQSGADTQRAFQSTATENRPAESDRHAENAAGVAAADGQQHLVGERDPDGRQPWKLLPRKNSAAAARPVAGDPGPRRDAAGNCGTQVDVSG